MSIARTACCLALLWVFSAVNPASAEVSGQQRAQAAGRAILGAPAPRVRLKTIDGGTIDLGSLYGKQAVYLKFWATWCVPCRQQMPHFEHVYETAGTDLAVVAIDVGFNDSIDAIQSYRKKLGITMPIVYDDGSLGAAFHLRVTPTHVVIGRDGRVLSWGTSPISNSMRRCLRRAARHPRPPDSNRRPRRTPIRHRSESAIRCPRDPCARLMERASIFSSTLRRGN